MLAPGKNVHTCDLVSVDELGLPPWDHLISGEGAGTWLIVKPPIATHRLLIVEWGTWTIRKAFIVRPRDTFVCSESTVTGISEIEHNFSP